MIVSEWETYLNTLLIIQDSRFKIFILCRTTIENMRSRTNNGPCPDLKKWPQNTDRYTLNQNQNLTHRQMNRTHWIILWPMKTQIPWNPCTSSHWFTSHAEITCETIINTAYMHQYRYQTNTFIDKHGLWSLNIKLIWIKINISGYHVNKYVHTMWYLFLITWMKM